MKASGSQAFGLIDPAWVTSPLDPSQVQGFVGLPCPDTSMHSPPPSRVSALHGPHGREQGRETPQRETQKMLPGDRTAAGQAEATYQHTCTLLA